MGDMTHAHNENVPQFSTRWRRWLNQPLSEFSCLIGWLLSTVAFLVLNVALGGPTEGDAAESVYSTWAIAHGQLACSYPPPSNFRFPGIADPFAFISPLYPLLTGALTAILRIGHHVGFPQSDRTGKPLLERFRRDVPLVGGGHPDCSNHQSVLSCVAGPAHGNRDRSSVGRARPKGLGASHALNLGGLTANRDVSGRFLPPPRRAGSRARPDSAGPHVAGPLGAVRGLGGSCFRRSAVRTTHRSSPARSCTDEKESGVPCLRHGDCRAHRPTADYSYVRARAQAIALRLKPGRCRGSSKFPIPRRDGLVGDRRSRLSVARLVEADANTPRDGVGVVGESATISSRAGASESCGHRGNVPFTSTCLRRESLRLLLHGRDHFTDHSRRFFRKN